MRVGDLVKLCLVGYPQYRGATGILVSHRHGKKWGVMINGRLHPYLICKEDMELVDASR